MRFINSNFVENYEPTIEESYTRIMQISKTESVNLEILDTAGTEYYTALRDLYIKHGDGFMLVYSVDSLGSFHELVEIYERIQRVKQTSTVLYICRLVS